MDFTFNDRFGFQPELVYSQQGGVLNSNPGTKNTLQFNYLNIPFMLRIYLTKGFSFDVGPQLGVMLSAKEAAEERGLTQKISLNDEISDFDFAMAFGLSVDINRKLDLSFRYNYGLAKMFKFPGLNITNSVMQISLRVRM